MRLKKPIEPIGMLVLNMRGSVLCSCPHSIRKQLESWDQTKRYWATAKARGYKELEKKTAFGTKREIIDTWLTLGYVAEKRLLRILNRLSILN